MKVAGLKNIYKKSLLLSFAEKSYMFRKREYLQGRKVDFPEILEKSHILQFINKTQKLRPKKHNKALSFLATALFFSVFIFTPLKSWLKGAYPVDSIYTFVVPATLILIAVMTFLRGKRGEVKNFTLVDLGILLLVVSLIASSLVSLIEYGQSKNILYEGFIWLSYSAIFYIGRTIFTTKKALYTFMAFNLVLVFTLSLVGIGQYLFGVSTPQWIEGYETIRTRAFSTLDNPIILSGYINIFFFIALGVFFGLKKAKTRILMIPLFAVLVTALGLTFSRGGWIAFVVGLVFFFIIYSPKQLLYGIPAVALSLILVPKEYFYRFLAIFDNRYNDISAVSGRVWTFNNVLHILPDHLLLGVGPGMYGGEIAFKTSPSIVYMEGIQGGAIPMQNTDNQYLQILIQQGLVGLLIFLFLVGAILYTGIAVYQKLDDKFLKMLSLGINTSAVTFFVHGLFADVLQFPQMSLFMFGFLGLMLSRSKF